MFKTIAFTLATLVCGSLIAFKPYARINKTLGLTDSSSIAASLAPGLTADSIFIEQPVAVVMPSNITDSIASKVGQREKQLAYYKEQDLLLGQEIKTVKDRVSRKQRTIQKEQQNLLGLEQIEQLMRDQQQVNTGRGVSKARDKIGNTGVDQADPAKAGGANNRP